MNSNYQDISKVRYKYLELIWYLKDTIKIPVFTSKRYLLDTKVGLKRYQYQFGLFVSSPPTCHRNYSSILPFFNASVQNLDTYFSRVQLQYHVIFLLYRYFH